MASSKKKDEIKKISEDINEEELFRSLMFHSENIINFYVPVFENKDIIDFRIVYFNEMAKSYIQTKGETAVGRLLSEVYPFVYEKGGIDFLKEAVQSKAPQTRIRNYTVKGVQKSLKTIVQPTKLGILATTIDVTENKELRDELTISSSNLESKILELEDARYFSQSVLDSSNNIITFLSPVFDNNTIIDFKINYVNERIGEAIGKDTGKIIGRKLSEFYPNGFKNGDVQILVDCYEKDQDYELSKQFAISQKKYYFTNRLLKLNDGVLIFSKDITKEKKYEQELELKNRLMSTAEAVAKIGSYKWNLDENILTYSDNAFRILGYEPGEFVPSYEKFMEFVHPDDAPGMMARAKKVLSEKKRTEDTYRLITKNGTHKWFKSQGEFEKFNGQWYLIGVLQDITEQRLFDEELALRNRLLNRAEKLANVGSFKWNLDSGTLIYSDNCYRIFGYEPDGFKPSYNRFLKFVHNEDLEGFEKEMQRSLENNSLLNTRFRILSKDNKVKHLDAVGDFYEREGARIMVGAIRDVTEEIKNQRALRERNLALERSNTELASFNRVASHDLQEPLRKIQMFASRIDDEDGDTISERSKVFLEKISSSSDRMRELIQNLLSFSKVGDHAETLEKVDLNKVLSAVIESFDERIKETAAIITADKLPSIFGIEYQLEQLLGNLISNSLKYKREGIAPKIKITSKILPYSKVKQEFDLERSRYLVLTLNDNGIGFEKEYGSKIFGMFQRLHSKNEFSGTGLGLAICQKIVQNHRGHIEATGNPDKGSTFTIYLPYSA